MCRLVVALVALFVALLAAALAAYVFRFLNEVKSKIDRLEHPELPPVPLRFAPNPDMIQSVFLPETVPEMDVVGAWALEEERAGRSVSLEEMRIQRQMWLEA